MNNQKRRLTWCNILDQNATVAGNPAPKHVPSMCSSYVGTANMLPLEKAPTGIRRSRRNLIKLGAIAAPAIMAGLSQTKPAAANCGNNGKDTGNENGNGNSCNCFLRGTTIRTADGNRKIEDLAAGDLLSTVFRGICAVQSIRSYTVKRSDQTRAWTKDVLPVRIARSLNSLPTLSPPSAR